MTKKSQISKISQQINKSWNFDLLFFRRFLFTILLFINKRIETQVVKPFTNSSFLVIQRILFTFLFTWFSRYFQNDYDQKPRKISKKLLLNFELHLLSHTWVKYGSKEESYLNSDWIELTFFDLTRLSAPFGRLVSEAFGGTLLHIR